MAIDYKLAFVPGDLLKENKEESMSYYAQYERKNLKIALIQPDLVHQDIVKNIEHLTKLLQQVEQGTDLIILPELFTTGFSVAYQKYAETMQDLGVQWMQEQARKLKCVITGSLLIEENDKIYNRLIWMQSDGNLQYYDKHHVFRMSEEKDVVTAGSQDLIVNLHGWKIKPLICYDLRFPVWSRNRYEHNEYQYDVLIYVACWPQVRSQVWKTLLPARAIENIAYTIGVNRVGEEPALNYSGDSAVYNYKGEMLLAAKTDTECVLHTSLSYPALQSFRQKFNVGLDWDKF